MQALKKAGANDPAFLHKSMIWRTGSCDLPDFMLYESQKGGDSMNKILPFPIMLLILHFAFVKPAKRLRESLEVLLTEK